MSVELILIITHQLLFQGMFILKNVLLKRRLKQTIRGWNKEATLSIGFFVIFIVVSMVLAILENGESVGPVPLSLAMGLLLVNLTIAMLSLLHLKDSWRVGVIEEQRTELITTGIYARTRNPYFVSYNIMFVAYSLLLQNFLLMGLTIIGFGLVHWMIKKEEAYLLESHGEQYAQYCSEVARYLSIQGRKSSNHKNPDKDHQYHA